MEDITWPLHMRFFFALGLSFLIGLERESSAQSTKGRVFAGVRTYTLIGVFGFCCAWLFNAGVIWAPPTGMIVISALAVVGYLAKLREGHVGWTSEVAAIITFIMGGLCLLADMWLPTAVAIATTFLLSEKAKMEKFVERLDNTEFLAVVRFLIVTLIILPILPNQDYTDFHLNPRHIWQVVVLVSSIGFAGYFLAKKLGDRMGLWLSGLLGGIVSSTAVSIAAGRIAQRNALLGGSALQASLIAGAVMYVRILVLTAIIQPSLVPAMWLKMVVLAAVGLVLFFSVRGLEQPQKAAVPTARNPFEIIPALVFGVLFVLLSVVTVLVGKVYGGAGLMVLAGVVGVTDIDPFILSMISRLAEPENVVITAIIISMTSNTLMKGLYFAFMAKDVRGATAWRYLLWAALHIPVILFL